MLSFDTKKRTTSGWALGDENAMGTFHFNWWICHVCNLIISQLSLKWLFGSSSNIIVELKWYSLCVFVQEHIEGTYNPAQLVKASDIIASLVYNRDKHLSGQVLVAWYPWQDSRIIVDCRNIHGTIQHVNFSWQCRYTNNTGKRITVSSYWEDGTLMLNGAATGCGG